MSKKQIIRSDQESNFKKEHHDTHEKVVEKKEVVEKKPLEPKIVETPVTPTVITLDVFAQLSGLRWEQFAGFKRHAQILNLGPLCVEDWKKAVTEFNNKIVE